MSSPGFSDMLQEGCVSLHVKTTDLSFCDRLCQRAEQFICQVSSGAMPQIKTHQSSYLMVDRTVRTIWGIVEIRSVAMEVIECGKF